MSVRARHAAAEEQCQLIILFLCAGIVVQMIGLPVTLLNTAASADALASSELEGFTVPPTLPETIPSPAYVSASDYSFFRHLPVLTSVLFRPPVRSHLLFTRPVAF